MGYYFQMLITTVQSFMLEVWFSLYILWTIQGGLRNLSLFFHLLERNRLRVADLGVAGGGRPWLLAAAEDRKVEK